MPEKIWDLTRLRDVAFSGEEIATTRAGLHLRRRDPDTGRYSPDGLYVAGEATLPDHHALGLTELYGLRPDADGRVLLRLSPDGGTTWLFHDGSAWVPATGWNTVEEVDREIPSFPITNRRVRIRVRLEPSPDGATPVLRCLALYLEHEVDFWEDLARSVKHRIEKAVSVPVHIATDVDFQVSEIPSIVLQLPTVTEVRRLRSGDRKLDWALARRRVRERLQPVWLAADLLISCQSPRKRETLKLTDALSRLFEYERTVLSEATGEEFTVTAYGPANAQDSVGRGLYVLQVALTLTGPAWLGEAQEKRLAETEVGLAVRIQEGR